MFLHIEYGSVPRVDRDGTLNDWGHQGMDLFFSPGMTIHFEDEMDAIRMAKRILWRTGESFDSATKEQP